MSGRGRPFIYPIEDGEKECSKCHKLFAIEEFIRKKHPMHTACRRCRAVFYGTSRKYVKAVPNILQLLDNGCRLCGRKDNLHIDHDHKTERFRGILCADCNLGVGRFKRQSCLIARGSILPRRSSII